MITFYHLGFVICLAFLILFFILTVVLFFVFDIRTIYSIRTGRAQRKKIDEMTQQNALTGTLRSRPGNSSGAPSMSFSTKLNKIKQNIGTNPAPQAFRQQLTLDDIQPQQPFQNASNVQPMTPPPVAPIPEQYRAAAAAASAAQGGINETSLLNDAGDTSLLDDGAGTSVLGVGAGMGAAAAAASRQRASEAEQTTVLSQPSPAPYASEGEQTTVLSRPEPDKFASEGEQTTVLSRLEPDKFASEGEQTTVLSQPQPDKFASEGEQTTVLSQPQPDKYASEGEQTSVLSQPDPVASPYQSEGEQTTVLGTPGPVQAVETQTEAVPPSGSEDVVVNSITGGIMSPVDFEIGGGETMQLSSDMISDQPAVVNTGKFVIVKDIMLTHTDEMIDI